MLGMGAMSMGDAAHAAAAGDAPVPPPLAHTNSQIDRALLDYEEEEDTGPSVAAAASAAAIDKCPKHDECLRDANHQGRCIWWDADEKKRTFIPNDDPGWNVPKPMAVEKKADTAVAEKPRMSRSAAAKAPDPSAAAKAPAPKAGKKRKAESDPFAAALAEQEKAVKAADAAERSAKKVKMDADAKVAVAAKAMKVERRREATAEKREAAKMRLEAEKAAREKEAAAEEKERMADQFSQQYG